MIDFIDHERVCFEICLIAEILGIKIPNDPKMVNLFFTNMQLTIKAHRKQAMEGKELADILKKTVNGR